MLFELAKIQKTLLFIAIGHQFFQFLDCYVSAWLKNSGIRCRRFMRENGSLPGLDCALIYYLLFNNGEAMVNIDDVTSLIDMLLGLSNPTYSIQNSDYNNDGSVDISDVTDLIDALLQ
jgi:hypothetical protein